MQPKDVTEANLKNVQKIVIPPDKRQEIHRYYKIYKMEHYRLYKLINNSTVSKSVTRK